MFGSGFRVGSEFAASGLLGLGFRVCCLFGIACFGQSAGAQGRVMGFVRDDTGC